MGVGRRARIRRHPRVQRESAAERTTDEHGLCVPADQRNLDPIQARGYYELPGIAAGRRWHREAQQSTEDPTWPARQILDLTVSPTEATNGVPTRAGIVDHC